MLSIVIPLFNEEQLLEELLSRTVRAAQKIGAPYELLCIDDGSTDHTLAVLKTWRERCTSLKIVVLSRNFGHQAAYTAGLHHSKGDYIALLDGDLQDPPEMLPDFYTMLQKADVDLVVGRRTDRSQKRNVLLTSVFHFIFRNVGELENMEDVGNFCMLKRTVANAMLSMNEKQRYLPGLRAFTGFKKVYLDFTRDARFAGKPKMHNRKLIKLATDAIFSFSDWPIKVCFFLGLFGVVTGLLAIVHTFVSKLFDWAPLGWSSTYLSIYFFGAVQLLFLGIIGGYVYRIYKEVQNRPSYFIREVIDN